jgi:hypothetical protein
MLLQFSDDDEQRDLPWSFGINEEDQVANLQKQYNQNNH